MCTFSDWERVIIVCVQKKGDLSQCSNWRGITLLSVPCKILSQLTWNRIRGFVDTVLREQQAAFRQERHCLDHIFVLRNIIEQCEEWQKSAVLNFVYFGRAFECVQSFYVAKPRDIWHTMKMYLPNPEYV